MDSTKIISAGSTNAAVIRKGACSLVGYYIHNSNAAARVVKLYDLAEAPVVGTSVPKLTLPIPANGVSQLSFDEDLKFQLGIAVATTVKPADNNAEAVAAEDLTINLFHR